MDLVFSLLIMLKKAFLLRPMKLYEFSTRSVRINSRPTKRSTNLAIVLHINLKDFEMCKTRISSRQRLVGLEFMRVEISLSFYSFSNVVVGRENRDQSHIHAHALKAMSLLQSELKFELNCNLGARKLIGTMPRVK